MTFLRCATRWHRAHLVCVCAVYPHSHVAIILFPSLSLSHLFRMLHASCVILWSAWRSGCPPLPCLSSPLSVVVHSSLLVSLFLTPCGSISHLYFLGLLTQLKKPNNAKNMKKKSKRKNQQIFCSTFGFVFHFSHFVSFASVCYLHSSNIFMVALKTHEMCPWHLWCDNVT